MTPLNKSAPHGQGPIVPRPLQIEAATVFDEAIWASANSHALFVSPVATGKTLILIIVACLALNRGCKRVVIVSRAEHIAKHCLDTLAGYALHLGEAISGGFYTGKKKQTGQILFATVQTLVRHIDVVEDTDLLLIDECDQSYVRETTKEYTAVLLAAKKYAGVTGTPFVLEKGHTVPIFGGGRAAA